MEDYQTSKWNRSFTRSEPNLLNCRQINVTEYFRQPGTSHELIRQYSFRELHRDSGDVTQVSNKYLMPTVPSFNNSQQDSFLFKTPCDFIEPPVENLTLHNDPEPKDCFEEHNCSPMDIDQSADQTDASMKEESWCGKKLNIKLSDNTGVEEKKPEVLETPTQVKLDQMPPFTNRISLIHIFLSICCSIVAIFLLFNTNVVVEDVSVIEKDLRAYVFNQNHIIDVLVRNLNQIQTSNNFKKLVVLVGSTGVGKTHLLNRIRNQYPDQLFISINYLVEKDIVEGKKSISLPKQCFILTVDDLKRKDVSAVTEYIKSITKSRSCMLVIPVFNIQETSEDFNHIVRYDYFKEIAQYFRDNFVFSESLLFNTMNRKHVEMWVKTILEERGINVEQHTEFIQSLSESHDVDSYGFKGIMPKVNLLS